MPKKSHAIWNSSSKEFLGRTWDSWAKIGIFYLIFYSCLAAFFAVMLVGFFQTIDLKQPTQQNMYSLLKANPGFVILLDADWLRVQWFADDCRQNFPRSRTYAATIFPTSCAPEMYAALYTHISVCTNNQEQVCRVGRSMFGEDCNTEKAYSFDEGKPCVMLKINKVFGWVPRSFNNSEWNDMNNTLAQEARKKLGDRYDPNYIGVSCEGENEADTDNMGPVTYFPRKGFPLSFYPYRNQDHYRVPMVYVKFEDPKYGALIQVWCRIWASNIKHHKNDKAGSIHFELLIE
ncbi:hypothetical protein HELRODRAFT_68072 [Helobdella robusta]|uniref:Sodium/potassium-transporting ATPase subunit beta n=1 Tax=Helobdella robusta TaxID=6412 RepID=T1FZ99_HELRO|nr:hypothetical protein HELRODRAFT_68072 [Helobdella robusta]ESN96281.1 hypothetical protein HELRODRAFT_68072 [Helobdella robusta]